MVELRALILRASIFEKIDFTAGRYFSFYSM